MNRIPTTEESSAVGIHGKEADMGYTWLEAQGLISGAPEWEEMKEARQEGDAGE